MLPFLDRFKKEIAKLENVTTDFRPPSHWYTTGNYAVNKALAGSYWRGIPQSRVTIIAGPSDSGKSFLSCNVMKAAQADGAFILAIDSENALDLDYLARIGVDTSPERFLGVSVVTVADAISTVSGFLKQYEAEYKRYNPEAPKVLIVVDSLDMLLTETELAHFEAGVQKGDQGQRAKQLKAFLRTVVSKIKSLNVAFVGTHQVYPADVLEGEGKWKINNAIRYSASQIILVTKLKLKEGDQISGIRMRVETFKSRFAKLGSKVEVLVPYDTGMNPYSGLLDRLEEDKVIVNNRGWVTCDLPSGPFKFQQQQINEEIVKKLFSHPLIKQEDELFESIQLQPEAEVPEPVAADSTITIGGENDQTA